jgi:single-strand DNA-binding protein
MAKGLNKVMLIGRLGKDPEIRYMQNGTAVANFTMATNRPVKKGDSWEEETDWHRIVAWDKLAEIASKYMKKGQMVYIEGQLRTKDWEDKEGNKRQTTEVFAKDLQLLSPKSQSEQSNEDQYTASSGHDDEDVPF